MNDDATDGAKKKGIKKKKKKMERDGKRVLHDSNKHAKERG